MVVEDFNALAEDLEKQELDAPGGVAAPQLYAKLLAIYLLQYDLCNAKFLWKRVPTSCKTTLPELAFIWGVGKAMWQRDFPAVYKALQATQWSENVSPIMTALHNEVRKRAEKLVCLAYTSLSVSTAAGLMGYTPDEVVAQHKDWIVESQMIMPIRLPQSPVQVTSSEEQLSKLTEFVSFLEN